MKRYLVVREIFSRGQLGSPVPLSLSLGFPDSHEGKLLRLASDSTNELLFRTCATPVSQTLQRILVDDGFSFF